MRTLRIVFLSLVAVIASGVCLLSSLCAGSRGFYNSGERSGLVICAFVSLGLAIAAVWAIVKILRSPNE